MKIVNKLSIDNICWILTVFLITSFTVFEKYSWGKLVFVMIGIITYSIYAIRNKKIVFLFGSYQKFFSIFIVSVFLNSIWSIDGSKTLEKVVTLSEIMIAFSLIYVYYSTFISTDKLVSAVKWGGYIVAIYTIMYYGSSSIIFATSRMQNDYSNVNTIGLYCAIACFIQVYEIIQKRKIDKAACLMIPSIIVIAATESRKAIIYLVIGVILLFVFKNAGDKNVTKMILQAIISIALVIAIIYYLSSLTIFRGINQRMLSLYNLYIGRGSYDHSAWARNQMIIRGIQCWLDNIIGGIGISTTGTLIFDLGYNSYLHNNYVDLLAGGGIICFVCYYSMYVYLFYNFFKYRRYDMSRAVFFLIWIILTLFMDYGMVSYYSKAQWFYVMIMFLSVNCLRRNR